MHARPPLAPRRPAAAGPAPHAGALLALALAAPASAGAGILRIQASVPCEVGLQGVTLAKTYTAGEVIIAEVPPGEHELEVWREGRAQAVRVELPEQGEVRLLVGADAISVTGAAGEPSGPAAQVRIEGPADQRFSIVLDGRPVGVVGPGAPLQLPALAAGAHLLQIRSADQLIVWAQGTLTVQPGDALVVKVQEGRMPEVFGRPGAWR
jgi:hypothetical protein